MWDLPGPGIEPVSPAPASRFFTMSYQGNPKTDSFQTWETISKGFFVGNLGKPLEMIKVRSSGWQNLEKNVVYSYYFWSITIFIRPTARSCCCMC